ncbi:MAG: galactokinase [Bacteroidales bacterium]|nr:galactokinase [Bacteroidales bacterium]
MIKGRRSVPASLRPKLENVLGVSLPEPVSRTSSQYHIFSPYRVCPIGAHVDHQHGIVTGFAIDKGVDLWFEPTDDGSVCLESSAYEGRVEFNVKHPTSVRGGDWGDYARGASFALRKKFVLKKGIRGRVQGSLPIGGLSASAAVLVAYVMAFAKANSITLTKMEVIKTASQAEREYIGLDNGILDQACIVLGEKNALLFVDTDSEEYRLIRTPEGMKDFSLGIFYSGLVRSLAGSDYNLRVSECRTAAWDMLAFSGQPLKSLDKTFLRDVPYKMFESTRDRLPERFSRRAEHFYTEFKRVRKGVTAWESGNLDLFGNLSFESCESSIHNYECGSPELIAIYDIMKTLKGVYGGRFSGAGFKGACIALVDPACEESIREELTRRYLEKFPEYEGTFKVFFCRPDDGARFID